VGKVSNGSYDTLVIGGGLGGLLAAASTAKNGHSVLVVERLPYPGGRFTTVQQEGCEITTGALHLVPHGGGGSLAQMLAYLGIGYHGVRSDVIASFFFEGHHLTWTNMRDILGLFGWRARLDLARILIRLKFVRTMDAPTDFLSWLKNNTKDARLIRVFERFVEFALSIHADEISYNEARAVFRSISRYGFPSAPIGGCKAVIDDLVNFIEQHNGKILTFTEAIELFSDESSSRVTGARIKDRKSGEEEDVYAQLVISDAGPTATARLVKNFESEQMVVQGYLPVARGLKLHILSDKSLIPHNGIMFVLDTKRISGIVQVSNAIPSVVPPGMHMLDTFQVLGSDDISEERQIAVEDLRYVFGADYDKHCRIVRSSAFRGSWPVNRITQGQDKLTQTPLPGLVMIGDAYKPVGHLMVEGVAGSVQKVLPLLS
jgi:phytoene dehydrogenase-like protein